MNTYEYAYKNGKSLVWRTVDAVTEKEANQKIRDRHKDQRDNSFFPYLGASLKKD